MLTVILSMIVQLHPNNASHIIFGSIDILGHIDYLDVRCWNCNPQTAFIEMQYSSRVRLYYYVCLCVNTLCIDKPLCTIHSPVGRSSVG